MGVAGCASQLAAPRAPPPPLQCSRRCAPLPLLRLRPRTLPLPRFRLSSPRSRALWRCWQRLAQLLRLLPRE